MLSYLLSHKYEQLLLRLVTFSKSIIFKAFEPNVLKLIIKKKSLVQICLPFYSSMLKSSIFKKNVTHLIKKRTFEEKKKNYSLSRFEFFKHVKTFLICVKL
jgi:hypothetical protein